MKKAIAILLTIIMVFGLFGCTAEQPADNNPAPDQNAPAPTETEKPTETTPPAVEATEIALPADFGGYKIGFYFLPDSYAIAKQYKGALDWIAGLTNCEMVYYDMVTASSEETISAHESLVSQGCDGIIFVGSSGGANLFEMFNKNGIYYVGMTRALSEDVAAVTTDSEYCAGWADERSGISWYDAYGPTSVLAANGCKKIAYVSNVPSNEMATERIRGVTDACEEFGMELITSYEGTEHAAGTTDILANYGDELDGLVGCMNGDACIASIQSGGYGGKVKYAQVDPPNDVVAYMEAGLLTSTIAGNNAFIIQLYMQLLNAMSGAERMFNDGDKTFPIHKSILIDSVEAYQLCEKYVLSGAPGWTAEEALQFNSLCNPDFDVKTYEELWTERNDPEYWNIYSIAERLGEQ